MDKPVMGVVVPATGVGRPSDVHLEMLRQRELKPCKINDFADIGRSHVYVDDIQLDDVVAVEFSTKHLLLCLLVDDNIKATIEDLKRPHRLRVVAQIGASRVLDQAFDDFRLDRVNYRCNTNYFVATPVTTKPSGLWVAELRFVAKLSAVTTDDDQETT